MSNIFYKFNTYEMSGIDNNLSEKFEGAATVGDKVYFAPHNNYKSIGFFDISSKSFDTKDITAPLLVSVVSTASP